MVELYGLKPNGQPINSNPYSKHSDSDGLEDNEERETGTNPRVADTDGDGILDGDDVYPLEKLRCWEEIRDYQILSMNLS